MCGSRDFDGCVHNGAAARICQAGDQVIICNAPCLDEAKLTAIKPRILAFDRDNRVVGRLTVPDEANTVKPVPLVAS